MLVLVVEDDHDIRMVARMALQHLGGFTVIEAASGLEALDVVSSVRPDVILLDVMMPGMDGTEVFRALREMPGVAGVPVLFLTAKAMPGDLERLRALGARAILTKPFDPATLPGLVREALADKPDTVVTRPLRRVLSGEVSRSDAVNLDLQALRQLEGLPGEQGGDLVSELIAMFASTAPDALRRLRAAALGQGADDAERVAHSLKGSAAMLGATGISRLARMIEALARGGRTREIGPLVNRIDASLAPTLERLRAHVGG